MTEIRHVSDTALWVAMYRAMETERPDAHFQDPLARRLAGPRGEAILHSLPQGRQISWPMVVRTCIFDEIILTTVHERRARLVVNLAAGLDTRPYRMDLPPDLTWVEVDLPEMIAYKEEHLAGEVPRCRLERVPLDLADLSLRGALLDRLQEQGPALVITEGLLIYLERQAVESLSQDLAARPGLRWWLLDHAHPGLLEFLAKRWGSSLQAAPFKFGTAEGAPFFARHGWSLLEERIPGEEARRLRREMPHAWLYRLMARFMPAERRQEMRRWSLYFLLENRVSRGL